MVSNKDYDAILMDIIMPVMNGLECARRIRQAELARGTKRRVPIIALSGNAQEVDRIVASEAGMDGYLTKPHTGAELLHKLELLFMPPPSPADPNSHGND
jgi:CheY-like chemotaxis protein